MIAMFSWTASNIHNASWKDQILSFYIEQQIQESYPDENAVLMFEKCSLERICKCKSFISMQFPLLPHQLKNSEGNKDIQKKKSLSSQTSPYNPHTFISLSKWGQILFIIISDWLIDTSRKSKTWKYVAGSGGPRQHVDSCSKSGEEDNQESRVKQDIDGLVDYCGVLLWSRSIFKRDEYSQQKT